MLPKYPKSRSAKILIRGAKALFVIELAAFSGAYYVWHRMNTSRDFRRTMHDNFPFILDGFYLAGEKLGDDKLTKKLDYEIWGLNYKSS